MGENSTYRKTFKKIFNFSSLFHSLVYLSPWCLYFIILTSLVNYFKISIVCFSNFAQVPLSYTG